MSALSRADRRLGSAVRRATASIPHGPRAAATVAATMSPGFRALVATLIARRATRACGLRALAAGAGAALLARAARDRLGRRRPGPRAEGGLPSRHAAAAAAITATVARRAPRLGAALAVAAIVGGAARIATAEHEPADIAAGALLGVALARVQEDLLTLLDRTGNPRHEGETSSRRPLPTGARERRG